MNKYHQLANTGNPPPPEFWIPKRRKDEPIIDDATARQMYLAWSKSSSSKRTALIKGWMQQYDVTRPTISSTIERGKKYNGGVM